MRSAWSSIAVLVVLAITSVACSDDTPGCDQHEETEDGCGEGGSHADDDGATSGGAGGGTGSGGLCADGEEIFCRCEGGQAGTKVCEGGAFGACGPCS